VERFVVPVVLEAASTEEAERFLRNMLTEGVRWDCPLPVRHIGDACAVASAEVYETKAIHLLSDGLRAVAVPGHPA
jgi:hypothetical protein